MAEDESVLSEERGTRASSSLAEKNGSAWWRSAHLVRALGFESEGTFFKVLHRPQQACVALNIPIEESFKRQTALIDVRSIIEYGLTCLACYYRDIGSTAPADRFENRFSWYVLVSKRQVASFRKADLPSKRSGKVQ